MCPYRLLNHVTVPDVLNPDESALLLDRGAAAIVGTPNRTYSGSGGALTLAFFDSLAYDGRSAGASMRHAKNVLMLLLSPSLTPT